MDIICLHWFTRNQHLSCDACFDVTAPEICVKTVIIIMDLDNSYISVIAGKVTSLWVSKKIDFWGHFMKLIGFSGFSATDWFRFSQFSEVQKTTPKLENLLVLLWPLFLNFYLKKQNFPTFLFAD